MTDMIEFEAFPKIPRLNREIIVTEKIDGTNAAVGVVPIDPDFCDPQGDERRGVTYVNVDNGIVGVYAQSRKRLITPENDNFGFALWVRGHAEELALLGVGLHFGEWWGSGIQRGYGLQKGEKRFSLFNTSRWTDDNTPSCVSVVPVLGTGDSLASDIVSQCLEMLEFEGSVASAGFMDPEGVVIYHPASNHVYKATIKGDEVPKALVA